jgi:cardiolipin synthase
MKVRFPMLTSRVNYRNHRKILVVDGKTAFVGGLNFADRYREGVPGIGPWRDTHLKIIGGGATALQIIFMADWYFVSKEILKGVKYFKHFESGTGKLVQMTASGPDSDWESISQAYFSAISTATDYVYISTPYLMPTSDIVTALKTSALGGIDVRIIVPGLSDAITPKWGTNSYIEELLEAGVKIYFYKAGFTHSKVIVVDGLFSSVGTANLDFRSLETNFEVNAMIYDEEIAGILSVQFLDDQGKSEQVVLENWINRPRINKIKESFARILSPML